MNSKKYFTLAELTKNLDVSIKGNAEHLISGVATIEQAQPHHITFLVNTSYRKYLASTQAGAVILGEDDAALCPQIAIVSRNPYFTYSQVAAFFFQSMKGTGEKHFSAVIEPGSVIDPTVTVGPHCVIGKRVKIAAGVILGAHCVIGDDVEIGECSRLDANVTIYNQVKIGKRAVIASGVIIGSSGFGFANQNGAWYTVPQLGGVEIGDDVDIGANTAIDRGAIENTVIENGVKLDNLIQVAHNVKIGAHTIIAGCTAIAGSTTIGKHCMIGGGTCFAGHLQICDRTFITGMTAVTKSISEPGIYSSGIVGAVPNHEFRKNNARFHRLENLMQRVKTLEAALKVKIERETT